MKQKTFFLIVSVIVLLMIGYFSNQLVSMGARWCSSSFDLECEANAMLACESNFLGASLLTSACDGMACYGYWYVLCDQIPLPVVEYVICVDEYKIGCIDF